MLNEMIENLKKTFQEQLDAATDRESLEAVRVAFLGKKSPVSDLMKSLRDMSPEEKKAAEGSDATEADTKQE